MPTRSERSRGLTEYGTFFRRAIREPSLVGAVAPSSPALASEMAAIVPTVAIDSEEAAGSGARGPVVVELGPGTGALSGAIAQRLPTGGRHIAVELDEGMVRHLREKRPDLEVIHGNAVELRERLQDIGVDVVDAIVSGLPWSIFPEQLQQDILGQIGQVLAPAGAFVTFGYVHALRMARARQFRRFLAVAFDEVLTSRTVWRNLPPARVYICRRPSR